MPSMIVAPQPLAVEEGAKVLKAGGNAIDAAAACALVQGIVSPQMCGIGGYALLTLHRAQDAGGVSISMDAPALAGSRVSSDMWRDQFIGPNPDGWGFFVKGKVNDAGYTSICAPGTVVALATMLKRWGTISWEQACDPAIRVAEEGFAVDAHLWMGWKATAKYPEACSLLDYIQACREARRVYLKADGATYEPGERFRNPDYGSTLRLLARQGPDEFYHGELAQRMSRDLEANGAFVTRDDLENYRLRDVQPVVGTYRGHTVASSTTPHGGPTLIEILNILEGYNLCALVHNSPEYIYLVSMAIKAAFADRNPALGDPDFVDVPLEWMMSKARAREWRAHIDAGKPIQVTMMPSELPDTTHVSVVDRDGNCVALTHSLGSSSGVITPGLGFMYNNSMTNFHPLPGHVNSIAPRKGRTTGMSPTVVYKDGQPILVLGAPGATRILTSVAQVILNHIDFGMSVSDAVLAPRFHCQSDLIVAQARIPEYVCAEVRKRHSIERMPVSHGGLGLVHAIAVDPASGRLSGGADAGAGGMALEV